MERFKSTLRVGAGAVIVGITVYTAYRKIFCREKQLSRAVKQLFNETGVYEFPQPETANRFYVRHLTQKNSTKDERDEAIDCLTRSFAGTTKTSPEGIADWVYCARTENVHEPLKEPPTPERLAFFRFISTWVLYYSLPRDGVFCLVSKETHKMVAVTCTVAPTQTRPYEMGYAEFWGLAMKTGDVPSDPAFPGTARRLEAYEEFTASLQKRLYPPDDRQTKMGAGGRSSKTPSLYVWMFGADPECQGTGCGSALIRFVGTVADADGVECYLETDGARNEGFYTQKGGFETKMKVIVESKGDKFDHDGGGIGMIRPAATT